MVGANDAKLIAVHKQFAKWKEKSKPIESRTDYYLAIRHFNKCGRAITRCCESIGSNKAYASAIATTQVIGGKVYWQSRDHKGWKQSGRDAPPPTNNGAPTKVFYNYNRDIVCRYLFALHVNDAVLLNFLRACRQRYKQFIRSGCQLDKTRYTGADNAKLRAPERAKRFIKYLQVCCNLHRGKDFKYVKDIFFPLSRRMDKRDKENVCTHSPVNEI